MKESSTEASLYNVVKNKIIEKIQSNEYKVGDKLPTEMELCNKYEVSRTTVRIALQQLVMEGKIYKVQGKGTFVSRPKILQSLTTTEKGFTNQMLEQGYQPTTEVVHLQVVPADERLSKKLNISVNDPSIN